MCPAPESAQPPVLELRGFGLAIQERVILRSLDFWLPATGCTVLLGPSGTGKSFLVRTLAGLNDQHPSLRRWGEVIYLGAPLAEPNRPALVVQKAQLLVSTVLDNLQSGLPNRSSLTRAEQIARIRAVASSLDEAWVAEAFSTPVINLGLKQQRVVSILRAMLGTPALLMLDEPTTGMHESDAQDLLRLIQQISTQCAVLVVLHHLGHARSLADRMLLIASGQVQEMASTRDFFESPQSEAARQFLRTGSCPEYPIEAGPPEEITKSEIAAEALAAVPSAVTVSVHTEIPGEDEGTTVRPALDIGQPSSPAKSAACGPRGFAWLLPGQLAGTPWPGLLRDVEHDLADLQHVGVSRLVNLTEESMDGTAPDRYGIQLHTLPIPDMGAPSATAAANLCVDIDRWIQAGDVVALHCRAGLGRTGTLLAAYWLWRGHGSRTAVEAVDRIRYLNNNMIQSQEQIRFLEAFAQRLSQEPHSKPVALNPD